MRRKVLLIVALVLLLPVVLLGGLLLLVQTDWAERRVEAMAGAALNRQVEIDGISVRWGWPPGLVFARLRISNPEWAKTKSLIDAEGLYARIRVLPLFKGMVVLPYVGARKAEAGLEMDGEKATWKFDKEPKPESEADTKSRLVVQRIFLDDGHIVFIDAPNKTNMEVDVKGSLGEGGELRATASGHFRGEPAKVEARVPALDPQHEAPIQVVGSATLGKTRATADGTFTTDGGALDMKVSLQGETLKHLSKVSGIVLPESPPYRIGGRLRHEGESWIFDPFEGRMGDSDLAGALTYTKGKAKPFLKARIKAKLLDLDDLAPLMGAPPKTGAGETAAPKQQAQAQARKASDRLLPENRFETEAWGKMDADVFLDAARIQRPKQVPIEAFSTHLVLKNSVVRLQPLNFGVAGGTVKADVTLDGAKKPMQGALKLEAQGVKMDKLFPTTKTMQEAMGTFYGRTELTGTGQSVAEILGSSNGSIGFAVDGGRISALLVELIGLDVAESIMLLGKRHNQVQLRCAVSTLNVKGGVASTESFVVDTEDTIIKVDGSVSLKEETMDIQTSPEPKDMSLVALRTPLMLSGPLRDPKIRPKAGPIAARVAGAAALGAIAPPLALLALIETGPGKDADCARLLGEAKAKGAQKKAS